MRIESIDIKNYRQHKEIHLEFPRSKETDLHVIVASNGVGKTNLMNAIIWCFYGVDPTGVKKDSAGLPLCNLKALEEAKEDGEEFVNVVVEICVTANGEKIVFTRSSQVKVATRFAQKPTFEVQVTGNDGETVFLHDDLAVEKVNMYVPTRIRQYFFFDGEQLHNYFGPAQDTTHVKDSIYEIAQINIVTAAKDHLNKLINEYRSTIAKTNPKLQEITNKISSKLIDKSNALSDIKSLEVSNKQAEKRIEDLNTLISGADSVIDDTKQYDSNEARLKVLEAEISQINDDLANLVRKYYVLLAMYHINERTKNYILDKDSRGKLPPDVNIDLIRSSLSSHVCAICNQSFSEDSDAVKHMQDLLSRYEVSTDVSNKLSEIKNDVIRAVNDAHGYMAAKEKIYADLKKKQEEQKELREANEKLTLKIRGISSVKQVGDWIEERKHLNEAIRNNDQKIGSYNQMVKIIDGEIDDLKKKEKKAISETSALEEIKKYKTFAEDALSIISSIESEIISDVKSKMEEETMRLFNDLVWKENTYGHIEFDDNFKLNLFSKGSNISCIETTSAAERELLALAFTIALHRVSGHDSPLFIDTPVGRVSDENRINFAKTLVDVSTQKQIVLAFTPSEYSEEIKGDFNENTLSSFVNLKTVSEETTIVEGAI